MTNSTEASRAVAIESLRSQQNMIGGVGAGLVAAIVGAGLWAAVTALTNYQIGWMAIAVGFLVGWAMRYVGKGIEPQFGYAGAVLSLAGCVLGNYLTVVWYVADNESAAYMDVLTSLGATDIANLMKATFDPMDLLFYGIAVYFGYRYSFTPIVAVARQEASP